MASTSGTRFLRLAKQMKRFRSGLVVGKFYPPHRGHKYLIDTALDQADQVDVLVTDTPGLTIPAAIRAAWVREIHPTARVRVIPDICLDDDSAAWARHSVGFLGFTPEAAFTSEDYGEPWARHMGCAHVLVDKARTTVPISGTRVRANPLAAWEFLEPCVRAFYTKRVCVLGAESTGTTTLARDLAAHYRTAWVPEYGRFYAEGKMTGGADWWSQEFTHIAAQQAAIEDQLARSANKVLVCDTDPLATSVWHERYMNGHSDEVCEIARRRRYDLYILTGAEIPFVQDGTRDGQHLRQLMHHRFRQVLERCGQPFMEVSGTPEQRLAKAASATDRLLAS